MREERGQRGETWDDSDGADFTRLVSEMADDAKLQFQLFIFTITATAAVLGFRPAVAAATGTAQAGALNGLFLAPLVLSLPSSFIILNRARTRNRKAAHVICYLDSKRLRLAGVNVTTTLADVKTNFDLPWETALHFFDRQKPHYPPALVFMGLTYLAVETLCILLAWYTWIGAGKWRVVGGAAALAIIAFGGRVWLMRRLKREISIQGFAQKWLETRYGKGLSGCPAYLRDWMTNTWAEV